MEFKVGSIIRCYFEESGGWTYGVVENSYDECIDVYWFDWGSSTEENKSDAELVQYPSGGHD